MITAESKIVWLVYMSGFGGDQLYHLLNQTKQFAFYCDPHSRITDQGKRLTEDLFGYKFQTNKLLGLPILKIRTPEKLLDVMNQCLEAPERVDNWDCPVIVKLHKTCSQFHLERIAPGSKIICMDSYSKNYQQYYDLAIRKNQEFNWFPMFEKELFLEGCSQIQLQYPTAYCADADAFFLNQSDFWHDLKNFLGVDFDVDAIMAEHAVYLAKQS